VTGDGEVAGDDVSNGGAMTAVMVAKLCLRIKLSSIGANILELKGSVSLDSARGGSSLPSKPLFVLNTNGHAGGRVVENRSQLARLIRLHCASRAGMFDYC